MITYCTATLVLCAFAFLGIIAVSRLYFVEIEWDDLSLGAAAVAVIAFFPVLMIAVAVGFYFGAFCLFVLLRPFFSAEETIPFSEIVVSGSEHRFWRAHDHVMTALLRRWHGFLYGKYSS